MLTVPFPRWNGSVCNVFKQYALRKQRGIGYIRTRSIALPLVCLSLCLPVAANAASDTLTFTNGDHITGKLLHVMNGSVSFHSDMLGDVSVPLKNVKELHSGQAFAAAEKGEHLTRENVAAKIGVGNIAIENGNLRQTIAEEPVRSFPAEKIEFLVDAPTFRRELKGESNFFYGWTGSITLGATLVKATTSAQTYTGSVAFVRALPTTAGLPPVSRTTLNLSGTYGLSSSPTILSGGNVFQSAYVSKTDILHGDTEYDHYFSKAIYGLANASADHNFGNGVQLQQAYGAGLGWSVVRSQKSTLDIKATLQYEQQQFYNNLISGLGTPDENLIGATVNETWNRSFKNNIKLNENVTISPAFNVIQAYSAVANASLNFPLYKNLNFTVSSTDNYLGDPPEGFLRNSFQFTTGINYKLNTVK